MNLEDLADRYSITVYWSEEDDAYLAVCPAFSGHSAFAQTPEEALREGRLALEGLIESYLEHGDQLPSPGAAAARPRCRPIAARRCTSGFGETVVILVGSDGQPGTGPAHG